MRPTNQTVNHHHYVKPGKLSVQRLSKDTIQTCGHLTDSNADLPRLESVSTEHRLLLRQQSSSSPNHSFTAQYGRCRQMVHYGINSTTRLHESRDKQLLAIKVYRRSILRECPDTSHSALLHPDHPNILSILDLLHNERGELCLVTPYCSGGDLNTLLSRNGPLPVQEADCVITQILRALEFLHGQATAHRDIRLETVLLTARGAVKLAGFGDGYTRRIWESSQSRRTESDETLPPPSQPQETWSFTLPWLLISLCQGSDLCSRGTSNKIAANPSTPSYVGMSLPYISPEGFRSQIPPSIHRYGETGSRVYCDPRPADVWATAITYMALITDGMLWRSACPHREDGQYLDYLQSRCRKNGYPPIQSLGQVC